MSAQSVPAQEADGAPWLFSATLTPHRSLGPVGFIVLMSVLSALSFVAGLVFVWSGAWPVFGFFGLDVALVYIAFRFNYRSGRLYERVDLDRQHLTLTRVHPSGQRERYQFPAYWVRVLVEQLPDGRSDLRLASHGRVVPFGRFLTDDERSSFAQALALALRTARQTTGF